MMKNIAFVALCMAALLVFSGKTEAVTCTVTELSPCSQAFTSNTPPSAACCAKLKEQKPCLCGYLRNPSLKQYVSSPNAKKVASTCGVAYPKC